jgi:hypothetical protein
MGLSRELIVVKLRFGENHHAYGDDFTGICDILNLQDGGCLIIGLKADKFGRGEREWVLDDCAKDYFYAKAKIGEIWWNYDLTSKPYQRTRIS